MSSDLGSSAGEVMTGIQAGEVMRGWKMREEVGDGVDSRGIVRGVKGGAQGILVVPVLPLFPIAPLPRRSCWRWLAP